MHRIDGDFVPNVHLRSLAYFGENIAPLTCVGANTAKQLRS